MFKMFEQRIYNQVDEYNQISDKPYKVSISFGMVPFSHTEEVEIEALMHKADILLYQQKKAKKARIAATAAAKERESVPAT
jgi:GGDEF domain-containing protein